MNETDHQADNVGEIFPALIAFQTEVMGVEKSATNPHLGNQYADLEAYLKATRPVLAKHGLGVTQRCLPGPQGLVLVTTLIHTSGQWMSDGGVPVPYDGARKGVNVNQAMGGAISYARRYAYAAILGLVQSDDDGNSASAPAGEPQSPVPLQPGYGGQTAQEPPMAPPQDPSPPPGWNEPGPKEQPQAPAQAPANGISPELAGWATTLRTQLRTAPHETAIKHTWENPQNQIRLAEIEAASTKGYNHLVEEYNKAIQRVTNAAG